MAVKQYIGARYVPKFFENAGGTSDWQAGVAYEPLTIVTYNSNSYTSKKLVPSTIGNPSDNPEYWVSTGIYNAQVEQYREDVERYEAEVVEYKDDVNALKSVVKKNILLISDSYGVAWDPFQQVNVEGWPLMLKNVLDTYGDVNDVFIKYQGGAALSDVAGADLKFANLITGWLADIGDRARDITDVILCAGRNDIYATYENIASGLDAFITNLHAVAPYAKMHLGMIGYDTNVTELSDNKHLMVMMCAGNYSEAIKAYNGIYLSGVENILKKNIYMRANEGKHPTVDGAKALAAGILEAYKNGYCTVNYAASPINAIDTPAGFSASNVSIFETRVNNNVVIDIESCVVSGSFGAVYCNPLATDLILGDIYFNYLRGIEGGLTKTHVNVLVTTAEGNYYIVDGVLRLVGTKLSLRIGLINGDNTNFETLNITSIQLLPVTFESIN